MDEESAAREQLQKEKDRATNGMRPKGSAMPLATGGGGSAMALQPNTRPTGESCVGAPLKEECVPGQGCVLSPQRECVSSLSLRAAASKGRR